MTTASAPLAAMSALALTPSQVDAGTLRQQMGASLVGKDPNFVSLRELREQVAIVVPHRLHRPVVGNSGFPVVQ